MTRFVDEHERTFVRVSIALLVAQVATWTALTVGWSFDQA